MTALSVGDDVYLSEYSSMWNVIAIVDQVVPMVVEKWASVDWKARADLKTMGIEASSSWPRLHMMIELKTRFLVPKQVRYHARLLKQCIQY